MSDKQYKTTKSMVLIAGILAAGLLAAIFATSHITMTASATSHTEVDNGQVESMDPQLESTVVTSSTANADNDIGDSGGNTNERSTLSTFGRAMTTTQPDRVSVTVGVETTRDTAQEAASDNAVQVSEIVDALRALGIADEQMSTSHYSLQPVYERIMVPISQDDGREAVIEEDEIGGEVEALEGELVIEGEVEELIPIPPPDREPRREIVGYRAFNSITVTLDTEGEVEASQVIDTAIETGATNVSNVFLFVSQERQQEIRNNLIVDAIADARQRADIAAGAVEMQITGIQSISLEEVHFPFPSRGFQAETLADIATPILPGEQEVTSTVHITYFIGSITGDDDNNNNDGNEEVEDGNEMVEE